MQERSRAGAGAGAEEEQGSSWSQVEAIGQEQKRGRSGSTPGLGQEHSRSVAGAGQEQGRSILFLFFAHIISHAIFHEQGRSGAGAGQE